MPTSTVRIMEYDPAGAIDHDGPEPPYRQLAGILAARIARGDWEPNRAIPSEAQLVGEYGLARATVRRAVALLVEREVVFVVPHRGTYVRAGGLAPRTAPDRADPPTG